MRGHCDAGEGWRALRRVGRPRAERGGRTAKPDVACPARAGERVASLGRREGGSLVDVIATTQQRFNMDTVLQRMAALQLSGRCLVCQAACGRALLPPCGAAAAHRACAQGTETLQDRGRREGSSTQQRAVARSLAWEAPPHSHTLQRAAPPNASMRHLCDDDPYASRRCTHDATHHARARTHLAH